MSPGSRNTLWLLAAIGVAAVLVIGRWPSDHQGGAPDSTSSVMPDASPDSPEVLAGKASVKRTKNAPLPPADAPLASIVEPLAARANAGDTKAACRLALELLRCNQTEAFGPVSGYTDEAAELKQEAKGNLDAADEIAAAELARLERLQQCQAIPAELRALGGHYLTQAARAGEPEAMIRYVAGEHWPMDGRGVFHGQAFDDWRRDSPVMLHRAFAAGVPEAPYYLMLAYQADYFGLETFIPDDPVKAHALQMLMARLHGWKEPTPPANLDATGLARAKRLVGQWHEGQFKGKSYRGQERAMMPFLGASRRGGVSRPLCSGDSLVP